MDHELELLVTNADLNGIKTLLASRNIDISAKNNQNQNVLHIVGFHAIQKTFIKYRHVMDRIKQVLNYFIKKLPKSQIDKQDDFGMTPFMYHAWKSQEIFQVFEPYLDVVNINKQNNDGKTVLHIMIDEDHRDRYHQYSIFKRLIVLEKLLSLHGINIYAQDSKGYNVLHSLASKYDDDRTVSLIIKTIIEKSQIDINSLTSSGYTAFHVACLFGEYYIVKHLLTYPNLNRFLNSEYLICDVLYIKEDVFMANKLLSLGLTFKIRPGEEYRSKFTSSIFKTLKQYSAQSYFDRTHVEIAINNITRIIKNDLIIDYEYIRDNIELVREFIGKEIYTDPIAELFTTIVMLTDDYLSIRNSILSFDVKNCVTVIEDINKDNNKSVKFCGILRRLPIELQMTICNRAFGSRNDNVLSINVTKHLKRLFDLFPPDFLLIY